jgi:hypothetical protein
MGRVLVTVGAEHEGANPPPSELSLDKHRLASRYGDRPGVDTAAPQYEIAKAGYVRFSSSRSRDDYTIVMKNTSDPAGVVVFDSRRLEADDIFAVALIRPGKYTISNTLSGARGEIGVSYPVIGKEPYRPPERLSIESDRGGFSMTHISLKPAQELSVQIKVPSRIKIELTEPADGPSTSRPVVDSPSKPGVGPSKPVVSPGTPVTTRQPRTRPLIHKKFGPVGDRTSKPVVSPVSPDPGTPRRVRPGDAKEKGRRPQRPPLIRKKFGPRT